MSIKINMLSLLGLLRFVDNSSLIITYIIMYMTLFVCIYDSSILTLDFTEYYSIVLTNFLVGILSGRFSYEIMISFSKKSDLRRIRHYPFEKYLQILLFIMLFVSYIRLFYVMLYDTKNSKGFLID